MRESLEYADAVVDEWMLLVKERDEVIRDLLKEVLLCERLFSRMLNACLKANREQLQRRLLSIVVSLHGLKDADTQLLPNELRSLLSNSFAQLRSYLMSTGCEVDKILPRSQIEEQFPSISDQVFAAPEATPDFVDGAFLSADEGASESERAMSVSSQSSSVMGREVRLSASQRFFPTTLNARVLKPVQVVDSPENLQWKRAAANALLENDEID